MNSKSSGSLTATEGWDTYWRDAADAAAYSAGGIAHPTILSFWQALFREMPREDSRLRCLDVASGSGAVVAGLYSAIDESSCEVTCIDASAGAIRSLKSRFPGVTGIVADAAAIPLDSHSFDVVTSQFGMEYAGPGASAELARLLAPGGRLGLLAHCRHSSIYRDCEASLDAVHRTQAANFIPLSIRLFEAGFAAVRGADREPYERAAQALDPAVRVLDGILEEHGPQVAGYAIRRLYDDVARIHGRMQFYEPAEVLDWLRRMESELAAFAMRMSSMCESALDRQTFDRLVEEFAAKGLSTVRADELADPADGSVLAWAVVAERPGDARLQDRPRPAARATRIQRDANPPTATGSDGARAARHVDWAKQQLARAVYGVLAKGIVPAGVVEAKPVWALPEQLVIGKLREPGEPRFLWVIGGDLPLDCIASEVAASPREAARHFVLKWQLEAARAREASGKPQPAADPNVNPDELESGAERLFGLVRNEALWPAEQDRRG